jgi:hypothetical protein
VVDFKKLAQSASDLVNKRGGMKSVQEDANELMNIAKGEGSLSDKAKRGADALKQPGARREQSGPPQQPARAPEPQAGHTPEGAPPDSSSPPNA